jgi:DNA (cytosine-5)-methyltransferase 1
MTHTRFDGHPNEKAAQRADEPGSRHEHQAGVVGSPIDPWNGLQVPAAREGFAWATGPRVPRQTKDRVRPRLLLAQAPEPALRAGEAAEVAAELLADQIGRQSRQGQQDRGEIEETWLESYDHLGMPGASSLAASATHPAVSRKMKSVELFAGAGGLAMGVSRAGFDPVAVVEWDKWAYDTIRENKKRGLDPISRWPLMMGDVRKFPYENIREPIDLVSGGPPCQPFSLGGKHRGQLDDRDMFPAAVRAVRELSPRAFLIENVKGLTRTAFAHYFEYIRLQLRHPEQVAKTFETWRGHFARLQRHDARGKTCGVQYNVVTRLLNAADYGVPQKRERVFIVGFRGDLCVEWSPPSATHSEDALLWNQWRSGEYWERHGVPKSERSANRRARARALALRSPPSLSPWLTVRDAISDLPDPERRATRASSLSNHNFMPGARSYPGHTGSPLDEPAKTLKAGDHGVPGGENMLRRPDGSIRYFTVRESARLQTFPDDYLFHGSWTEIMRQLGNAVPVTLAEIVASSIQRQLVGTVGKKAALQSARQAQSRLEHREGAA